MRLSQLRALALLVLLGALVFSPKVMAQEVPPDARFDLPAGLACVGFDLRIEIWGNSRVYRQFVDRSGNVVRIFNGGTGSTLRLSNLNAPDLHLTLRSNGATTQARLLSDGSTRVSATGHQLIVLFPTDVPAGPSTTLVVGLYQYLLTLEGTFIQEKRAGRTTDLCAILGG